MRLSAFSKKKQDENKGLKTERQITLYRKREAARRVQAERREADARAREAEARVRHLNLGLIERVVFLTAVIAIGLTALIGTLRNPELTQAVFGIGGLGGVVAAACYRRSSKMSSAPRQPEDYR